MSSSGTMQAAPKGMRRPGRDLLILAGFVVLVVIGLAGLAAATGWEETAAALGRLGPWQMAALLLLSLANYFLRALRWHLFARKLGLPSSTAANFRHFIGGLAMSATPGRVGELVRMRWIGRETGWSFERSAPLALVDRAADLLATALLLAVGLSFSTVGVAGGLPVVVLAIAAAWVATDPKLLSGIALAGYRLTGRLPRLFGKLRAAARSLSAFRSTTTILVASLVGFVGWFAEAWAFHLLLVWMGAEIDLWSAVAIFTFSTVAGALTGAPGGLGGAEAAMVALLTLRGIGPEIAIPATLVIRLTTLWFAIGIGLLVFPAAERLSKRNTNAA